MQLKPPTPLPLSFAKPTLFLAGSIEQGTAEDWQAKVVTTLSPLGLIFLNPRREEGGHFRKQGVARALPVRRRAPCSHAQ